MDADIVLNGGTLELRGNVVAPDSEIASTGAGAGYSFQDRTDASKRFVLYADKNKARLWKQGLGDVLTVADKVLEVDGVKTRSVTVDAITANHEVVSTGPVAGFSFRDRADATKRFVLYADKNKARLWKEGVGDVLTMTEEVLEVETVQTRNVNAQHVVAADITIQYTIMVDTLGPTPGPGKTKPKPKTIQVNVLEALQALQKRVDELEKKLAALS